MTRLKAILGGACLVAVLVVTPSAHAAVTASSITTPADPSFFVNDSLAASNTFAISGTTTGGTTGDHVDIRCFFDGTFTTVASNVAVGSDGSFSVPDADVAAINGLTCRLRAVPSGTSPVDLTPFAGPQLGISQRLQYTVGGNGPNAGTIDDYYFYDQQLTASTGYYSLGDCGLVLGYLYDTTGAITTDTWDCNDYLWYTNGADRSELQVDGANAFSPAAVNYANLRGAGGFPALSYTYTVDPHTGNLEVHETDPLVKCTDPTFPPTQQTCPTLVSTGVTDHRTITTDHDGHLIWITDAFTSTDGQSHSLDLEWENDNQFHAYGNGDSTQLEYEFPGASGYSTHTQGDTVSLPNTPGTIFVRMHGAADGDMSTGQGAIVYDRPLSQAIFYRVSTPDWEGVLLHQTATVPAGSSMQIRFAYVEDYQSANVASLADLAAKTFKGCTVPKLKGKKLAAAKTAITNAGCTVGKVTKARSAKVKKGRVISSKPKAGKHLDYLAKVGLKVSKGAKKR